MKRIILLSLLLFLLMGACSTSNINATETGPITLTLWHSYNGSAKESFDSLVQSYNETLGQEEGVVVDTYAYTGVNNLADAVLSSANQSIGSPKLPDIFSSSPDSTYRLDALSIIAPLDPYFTQDELENFNPDFLKEAYFDQDGGLKMVPFAQTTDLLYLNATDFEEFALSNGISLKDLSTWEGLARIAKLYYDWTDVKTAERHDGKALLGIHSFDNFMIIASKQLGGDIYQTVDGGARFSLSRERAQKIWDLLYIPYLSGHYASKGCFPSDDTKTGDLLAYIGSTAGANNFPRHVEEIKDQPRPIDCKVLPYPYFEGGEKVAILHGAGMSITKTNERRERAAANFLKWLAAPEQNLPFAVATGYIPVYKGALSRERMMDALSKASPQSETGSIHQTLNVFCDTLREYTFYNTIPFPSSYEARALLASYTAQYLQQGEERLASGLAQGKSKHTLIKELSSPQNFDAWYQGLLSDMEALMGS